MDLPHSVIGFRAWIPGKYAGYPEVPAAKLRSLYMNYWWDPKVNKAVCHHELPLHPRSSIPARHCECGLYAMHEWVNMPYYHDSRRVWGIVRGWGQLRCHQDGWRAQYAEIVAIIDTHSSNPEEVASYYEVPWLPINSVPQLASEFGLPIPREMRPTKNHGRTKGEDARDILVGTIELGYMISKVIGHKVQESILKRSFEESR